MEKGMKLQLYRTLLRKAKRATSAKHLFRFQDDCTSKMWGLYTMYDPSEDRKLLERIFPESAHAFIDNSFSFGTDSIYRRSYIHPKSQTDLMTENAAQEPPIIQKLEQTIKFQNEMNENSNSSNTSNDQTSPLFDKYQPNLDSSSKENLESIKNPKDTNEDETENKKKRKKSNTSSVHETGASTLVDYNLTSNMNEGYIPRQIYPTPLSSSLSNYIVTEYDRNRLNSLFYHIFKHYTDLDNIPKIEKKIKKSKRNQTNSNNNNNNTNESDTTNATTTTTTSTEEEKEEESDKISYINDEIEYYRQPPVTEISLMKDGFSALTELDRQIEINECTSIAEASGIRVIVTSRHCPDILQPDRKKPYSFTYKIRIENHGHEWVQLVGRHWIIEDSNGKKEIVQRFAPGVVGQQPGLESGDIFIYGSGVFLATQTGVMKGSFQFNAIDGNLFEVPVAPFRLIANQDNR